MSSLTQKTLSSSENEIAEFLSSEGWTKEELIWMEQNYPDDCFDKKKQEQENGSQKDNVNINGNYNSACKRTINEWLEGNKQKLIDDLAVCTYRTPPVKLSNLLSQLFNDPDTKEGHWLYIAQQYNPRAINRTIKQLIKHHKTGAKTITKPAKYFTFLIKKRKKRRSLRGVMSTKN